MSFTSKTLIAALAAAIGTSAHGHVTDIVVDGAFYQGYDVTSFPYMSDPPAVVGWSTTATDNGFVAPESFGSADIICHRGAENAGGFATVEAGGSIMFEWNTWPESHHGPIIDYIANCGDSCETVDKSSLEWVKVQAEGLVDGSSAPGTWASDTLIANGNRWVVTIPESLAAGNYVVRHEIIALHSAGQENGAQNYPQCVNIQVTGGGSDSPSGVLGTELYKADDAGILFNIYQTLDSYPMPGPELYSGAVDAAQEVMEITATSSATTNGDAAVTTSASAITSSIAEVTTTAGVEDTPSTTASIITSATALETIATSAPVATKIAAEEPATTTTRAPCTKQKHRRHARHV